MKKEEPKISIITKTYNSGETLVSTLESVSTFGEIIAIDEHSTDDTLDILKEYKVKTIFADKNNLTFALNQALEEARGNWIFILEDDEIVPKTLLDKIQNYILNPKKNRNCLSFEIKTFYLNKEIKSAKEKNIIRFFKKGCCVFKENNSFELKLKEGKSFKIKKDYILKYLQSDISRYLNNILEKNKNILKFENSKSCSPILAPIAEFFKFYIFKLGIFDGIRGLIFARKKATEKFILETMIFEKKSKEK